MDRMRVIRIVRERNQLQQELTDCQKQLKEMADVMSVIATLAEDKLPKPAVRLAD